MLRFRTILMALCVLLFFAPGCTQYQGGKNAWKSTSRVYNKYINTPARLKLDESNPLKTYQTTLIQAITDIDFELEELLRAMDDSDRTPDEDWALALMKRFPWLSGTFMADGRGRVMTQVPYSSTPLVDFTPLPETDPKQRQTDLRAAILNGESGPVIYLAKPVYLQEELRVLIVCHFDLRSLMARMGEPERFMVVSGDTLLWSGVYNYAETPVNNTDWNELALKKIDGIVENETGKFYWLASYFANIQLIYSTPVTGDFSVDPKQMTILRSSRFAGTGR